MPGAAGRPGRSGRGAALLCDQRADGRWRRRGVRRPLQDLDKRPREPTDRPARVVPEHPWEDSERQWKASEGTAKEQ